MLETVSLISMASKPYPFFPLSSNLTFLPQGTKPQATATMHAIFVVLYFKDWRHNLLVQKETQNITDRFLCIAVSVETVAEVI